MSETHKVTDNPQAVIADYFFFGLMRASAVFTAAELGVADLLSDRSVSVSELASATHSDKRSLYRLMRFLASYGIFEETERETFKQTRLSSVLQSNVPGSLNRAARVFDRSFFEAVGSLLPTIRDGKAGYERAVGMGLYDYLSGHPDHAERFDSAMANMSEGENQAIAAAYDFSRFDRIVEIGGGRGGLLAEILKINNRPRGVLFDRPEVIATPTYLQTAGVAERCEVVGGSFHDFVPKGGDAYVIKRVLLDWDDQASISLLRRCREAMATGGSIVVIDGLVSPGNGRNSIKDLDLLLMVLVTGGGARTEEELQTLYRQAGLEISRIVPTPGELTIIEGKPTHAT